jgi:8-oxo-dGTP pyrophosphatase MutT (NUDIX family)
MEIQAHSEQTWQVQDRFLELRSAWMTLIGEHWQDDQGKTLEYWRIEKADSVIILPIQEDRILLPRPHYRPGVGQVTLDFPGGRVPSGRSTIDAAIMTLQRELGIDAADINHLSPLNHEGWAVNSSFSNQRLYGFVADINKNKELLPEFIAAHYPINPAGVRQLNHEFTCLQCRALLLQWWLNTERGYLHENE